MLGTVYNKVPYPSAVYAQTHPDRRECERAGDEGHAIPYFPALEFEQDGKMQSIGTIRPCGEHAPVNRRDGIQVPAALRRDRHLDRVRNGEVFVLISFGSHVHGSTRVPAGAANHFFGMHSRIACSFLHIAKCDLS